MNIRLAIISLFCISVFLGCSSTVRKGSQWRSQFGAYKQKAPEKTAPVSDSVDDAIQRLTARGQALDSLPPVLPFSDILYTFEKARIHSDLQTLSQLRQKVNDTNRAHRFIKYDRQYNPIDSSQKHIHALIISGGGVKGSFAVGVLDGMRKRDPDFFKKYSIFAGTSTGSFIAPLARMGLFDSLRIFYTNEDYLNSYYSSKGNLPDILRYDSAIYNTDGLTAVLRGVIERNYDQYLRPSADTSISSNDPAILIATVSMNTGELILHSNKNPYPNSRREFRTHSAGHGRKSIVKWDSTEDVVKAIMASGCQPVFADLVTMTVNNTVGQFADGGVRSYMPIEFALALGATDIDVIQCSPLFFVEKGPYSNTVSILNRTLALLTDQIGLSDVDYAEEMMDGLRASSKLETTLRIYRPPYGDLFRDDNGDLDSLLEYKNGKEHAEFPFGGSNLKFDSKLMQIYYNKGLEIGSADDKRLEHASQIFEKHLGQTR